MSENPEDKKGNLEGVKRVWVKGKGYEDQVERRMNEKDNAGK
jgi:hypothetical protein